VTATNLTTLIVSPFFAVVLRYLEDNKLGLIGAAGNDDNASDSGPVQEGAHRRPGRPTTHSRPSPQSPRPPNHNDKTSSSIKHRNWTTSCDEHHRAACYEPQEHRTLFWWDCIERFHFFLESSPTKDRSKSALRRHRQALRINTHVVITKLQMNAGQSGT
jgi:hypothetical protein